MAVKVIDKLRFPTKQESQLRNEVAILQVTPEICGPTLPPSPPRKGLPFPLPPLPPCHFLQSGDSQGRLPSGGTMRVETEGVEKVL